MNKKILVVALTSLISVSASADENPYAEGYIPVMKTETVPTTVEDLNDKVDEHYEILKNLKKNVVLKTSYDEEQEKLNAKLDKQIKDEGDHAKIFNKTMKKHNDKITNLEETKFDSQVANGRFQKIDSRLDRQDKRLRRSMAAQYAMSGLFQPYNVGRINVTAAIGGYKSEQAIAIGAGYRVNNNLAVKAGIATNLNSSDGAGYNIGMNYEF